MTFWPLTNSDFPTNQTFHQFHDLHTDFNLPRIMSGFHGAFATDLANQKGTLTLPDTLFRPAILGFACAPIVEIIFLVLVMSILDFSPRIPLGNFSILLFFFLDKVKSHFSNTLYIHTFQFSQWNIKIGGDSSTLVHRMTSVTAELHRSQMKTKPSVHFIRTLAYLLHDENMSNNINT